MILKYYLQVESSVVINRLKNLTNQIYKLLPTREQNQDWQKPLQTILVELAGQSNLLNMQELFFPLISKLQGLFKLTQDDDFMLYRRTIFECLGILDRVMKECQKL